MTKSKSFDIFSNPNATIIPERVLVGLEKLRYILKKTDFNSNQSFISF